MSTITKEWLKQKIADMEGARDEIPFGLDEDDSNTLAALSIALASLEAEAVAWIIEGGKGDTPCHLSTRKEYVEAYPDRKVTPLYAAPPAPVSVPDELSREEYKRRFMEDDNFDDSFRGGWNACRAAMLQGGKS